jgi:hypothetical protein
MAFAIAVSGLSVPAVGALPALKNTSQHGAPLGARREREPRTSADA